MQLKEKLKYFHLFDWFNKLNKLSVGPFYQQNPVWSVELYLTKKEKKSLRGASAIEQISNICKTCWIGDHEPWEGALATKFVITP